MDINVEISRRNFLMMNAGVFVTVILSFWLERIMLVVFHFLPVFRGMKTPATLGVAFFICWLWQFDVLSATLGHLSRSLFHDDTAHQNFAVFITSLLLTGGSKGVTMLLEKVFPAEEGGHSGASSSLSSSYTSSIVTKKKKKRRVRKFLGLLILLFYVCLFLRHQGFLPQDTGYVVVNRVFDFHDEMVTKIWVMSLEKIYEIEFEGLFSDLDKVYLNDTNVGETPSPSPSPSEVKQANGSSSSSSSPPPPTPSARRTVSSIDRKSCRRI